MWVKVVWMAPVRTVSQNSALPHKVMQMIICLFEFSCISTNELNLFSLIKPKYWSLKSRLQKDFHFQVLPFFPKKASRRISQDVGGVQRIWEESHHVPPACTQAWEFQSQITNTMDYRWSLHMQWFFAAGPELMLLLQGTRSNSKCILSIYVYWSPPSQHEQRTIDFPPGSVWQSSNFYRA